MKKFLFGCLPAAFIIALISWGYAGHRTVGFIAERHLTPQAKVAVHQLLGNESLADVANWADEVKSQPDYKSTASWHFLNEKEGLSKADFTADVRGSAERNVYSAILAIEKLLGNPAIGKTQKAAALKFLVHLVGDAHQPMHVSRAEDRGGNTIQVKFNGQYTSLHSLWDNVLLDKEGLSDEKLATKIDTVKPDQIKEWQEDDPIQWMWESYEISTKLYQEVGQDTQLGDDYYASHINIVNERLEQAGIRLAGILNKIFGGISDN